MIIMAAALAGMLGPVLFVTVILALTALQYDFMLEIGWRPLADPADAWPSGLALGPYGLLQDANFVASGLLLALFATGLHLGVGDRRGLGAGPGLLLLAGTAMALIGFESDPIRRVGPRSLLPVYRHAAHVDLHHRHASLASRDQRASQTIQNLTTGPEASVDHRTGRGVAGYPAAVP
jgi:hypothetical protein